ncbi:4Fe-4S dicluster domain-containing protein [Dictyobacter kobayashii]|uniref:4Fe-4S ferredoxin-type domain-containing protein n=1 Tax=Dictyobacter kobayashii TaxID=2014872 RepID=A0A402AJU5_9CHLR|nr:4Fe-4S dicluster domain-containing protein [Dictyobacter kobayashii]GCE19458.1 hypothetical protein KDK_32580 [Dictyobacter kobayashii]
MIYIDYIERQNTVASSPTLCMHSENPLAPAPGLSRPGYSGQSDGVVQSADETRCIYCENCGYACPFGIPKFHRDGHYMQKCNLCYDRTSQGKGPMCATVCPTQAIFYGTYEEWMAAGRAQQGAKPVNTFYFGRQRVQTRNYVIMPEQEDELDLMALVEKAELGLHANLPAATANQDADTWVDAETAGIPQREIKPSPWTPLQPLSPTPTPTPVPAQSES